MLVLVAVFLLPKHRLTPHRHFQICIWGLGALRLELYTVAPLSRRLRDPDRSELAQVNSTGEIKGVNIRT